MSDPGHVFIVNGDLTKIACDAWLMPCGIDARPQYYWLTDIESSSDFRWPRPPEDWGWRDRRCFKLYDRCYGAAGEPRPIPWVTNVGGGRRVDIEWFVDGVREFMARVSQDVESCAPINERARPLIALPIVGTGFGGARMRAGQVVQALLPCLYESAHSYGFDIALVIRDLADYAAAQRERRRYNRRNMHRWPELSPRLRANAETLAEAASAGELVVFMGAGVSRGAGLPTWGQFLQALSADSEQLADIRWEDLSRWSYADQARIIENGFGGRREMGQAISRHLLRRHYSLMHGLLASLPVQQSVTTNYDTLFELASESIGRNIAVLPYDKVNPDERWILKMHGCIEHPDDIVLTREDYLRYAERRRALAGVVQSLLITKHMLFVGFSLDDDNFHRIADDVRKIVWANEGQPFGTSIVLVDRPFLAQMWDGEIDMVVMREGDESPNALREAARLLEIFLDYVLAQVADPNYLLNPRFGRLLSEEEAALRDQLWKFVSSTNSAMRETPAWTKIERMLIELGWDGRFRP